METQRRHDIDWLRVIAIGLLVVYHISIVFQPWAMFVGFIRSDQPFEALWAPMSLINIWRIPFLFFVSGMGVYFAMRKRNVKQLLLDRALRIGLPYVVGIVLLVPLHLLIFQDYYQLPATFTPHPAHVWFLGNIIIYVSGFFAFFFRMMRHPEGRFHQRVSRWLGHPLGQLSIALFFVAEVLIVQPQLFTLYAQTLHGYAIGMLGFFFGFLFVYAGSSFWPTVLRWRWAYLAIAIALGTVRLTVFKGEVPNALMAVESYVWILSLFGWGYRYLNRPSALLTYLSQAAYPVYLIHMIVLYGAASFNLPLSLTVEVKFILIVLVSLIGCLGLYEFLIRRVFFLRPLFGLPIPKPTATSTEKVPFSGTSRPSAIAKR